MSVAPEWHQMKGHRIPERLGFMHPKGTPAATGANSRCIWRMGEGPFENGELTADLHLRKTGEDHGQVEPARVMPLEEFSDRLAETRSAWHPMPNDPWSVKRVYDYGRAKR